jgi:hypothetical protein
VSLKSGYSAVTDAGEEKEKALLLPIRFELIIGMLDSKSSGVQYVVR